MTFECTSESFSQERVPIYSRFYHCLSRLTCLRYAGRCGVAIGYACRAYLLDVLIYDVRPKYYFFLYYVL